ncbi:MAG: hypothetical protein OEQ13_08700 [Acidobacteriota bacterium]|nr:hypothetical protein [Acidobacteriota bacterium]
MKRFRMVRGLALGLAGVALVLGGVAVASNMGFKFVPNIPAGENLLLSLPWNNNYTKASELMNDLDVSSGNGSTVSKVNTDASLTTWFYGGPPANNYTVAKGEAFLWKTGTSSVTASVIVGSHDPNFKITVPASQNFAMSVPYHTTYTAANGLLNAMETPAAGTTLSSYNTDASLTTWFYGGPPANNFAIVLGKGVLIKAGASGITNFAVSHY